MMRMPSSWADFKVTWHRGLSNCQIFLSVISLSLLFSGWLKLMGLSQAWCIIGTPIIFLVVYQVGLIDRKNKWFDQENEIVAKHNPATQEQLKILRRDLKWKKRRN